MHKFVILRVDKAHVISDAPYREVWTPKLRATDIGNIQIKQLVKVSIKKK